jgi:hypothetical protein
MSAEVPANIAADLQSAVGGSTVVLLLDDSGKSAHRGATATSNELVLCVSGSMLTGVRPPNSNPMVRGVHRLGSVRSGLTVCCCRPRPRRPDGRS